MTSYNELDSSSEQGIKTVRLKTLELLKFKDRTEQELRNKLLEKGFCEELVDEGINYAYSFHYLDDVRYAEHFIRIHRELYSTAVLKQKLLIKGVSSSDIVTAFDSIRSDEEEYSDSSAESASLTGELKAAVNALSKKLKGPMPEDPGEGQKLLAYMYRKGFSTDTIRAALESINNNDSPLP